MTAREDAIEAGAKAIGAHRKGYGWERDDETWKNYVTLMEWAVDAVEPIIRADALAEFEGATVMDRRAWRDEFVAGRVEAEVRERLRAQVEALRDEAQRTFEQSDYCDESARARADALADVLHLWR